MSYYPDLTYPTAPGFPTGHEDVPIGNDLYNVIVQYITDLTIQANLILDHEGNIELDAAAGIIWDGTTRISLLSGEIHITALEVSTNLYANAGITTLDTLTIAGDIMFADNLTDDGSLSVTGTAACAYVERDVQTLTQAAEPGDPANDHAIFWVSNGTGYGDVGDLCCKITEGGGTTSFTISDYSTL